MGTTNTKIEYECNCGYNYGDCEFTNAFYLSYNRSVDLGTLHHRYHNDVTYLGTFNDAGIQALVDVLTTDGEHWNDDDKNNEELKCYY